MLFHLLYPLSEQFAVFNVFRYITFRAASAVVTALLLCLLLGPAFMGMVALFFLWNWLYSRWLKRVPVLDVMGIGMSFVIRATAGVMVILIVSMSYVVETRAIERVPLAVIEGKGQHRFMARTGGRKGGGGVESSGEHDDGAVIHGG